VHSIIGLDVVILHKRIRGLKNIYLVVRDSKTVEIKTNLIYSNEKIESFLHSKIGWIQKKLYQMKMKEENQKIQKIFGNDLVVQLNDTDLEKFYIAELEWYLVMRIPFFLTKMGLNANQIKIRKYKTKWGSCDKNNNLCFNLLLAAFDKKIIDYVIVHELAHIVHKHHQREFWEYVRIYCHNYKDLRKRLKYPYSF